MRKDSIISEINISPEAITIQAQRIDLVGVVHADEFISELINAQKLVAKFATIEILNATSANLQNIIAQKASITDLNATNAEINNLKVNKLDVSDFTAENISAMSITVKSANVIGGFNASKITSGKISAERLDVSGILSSQTFQGATITVYAVYAKEGFTYQSHPIQRSSITFLKPDMTTETMNVLKWS